MKPLIAFALPAEKIEVQELSDADVLFTKVGKVRAAFSLTSQISKQRPSMVLNIGTAGTLQHSVGDIIVSRRFIDRDYERIELPGLDCEVRTNDLGCTTHLPSIISGEPTFAEMTVNTGDDFVTAADRITGNAVDMEAYALAYVCEQLQVPFVSVKYVTDVIGSNSVGVWEERLVHAREALTDYFAKYAAGWLQTLR